MLRGNTRVIIFFLLLLLSFILNFSQFYSISKNTSWQLEIQLKLRKMHTIAKSVSFGTYRPLFWLLTNLLAFSLPFPTAASFYTNRSWKDQFSGQVTQTEYVISLLFRLTWKNIEITFTDIQSIHKSFKSHLVNGDLIKGKDGRCSIFIQDITPRPC